MVARGHGRPPGLGAHQQDKPHIPLLLPNPEQTSHLSELPGLEEPPWETQSGGEHRVAASDVQGHGPVSHGMQHKLGPATAGHPAAVWTSHGLHWLEVELCAPKLPRGQGIGIL